MPTYRFKNEDTGEEWEQFMKISERDEFLQNNSNITPLICGAPGLVTGTGDGIKQTGQFNEIMSRIAEQNPYSPLADSFGKKDATSVKVRDAVKNVKQKIGGALE